MTQTKTRRPRRTYTDEFKNQLVQLYLNGKRKCDIVREYDISSSLLDKWIKQSTSTGSFKEKDNRSEEEQELIWIVNTKLNNFFKGVFTILNWGQIT